MSLTETHFEPHFNNRGFCQCACNDCHTRLEGLCLCLDCPCSDPGENHEDEGGDAMMSLTQIAKILGNIVVVRVDTAHTKIYCKVCGAETYVANDSAYGASLGSLVEAGREHVHG